MRPPLCQAPTGLTDARNPLTSPVIKSPVTAQPARFASPARAPGRASPRPSSSLPRSPHSPAPSGLGLAPVTARDFSHLLRPEIFHQLTPVAVPPPFRNSAKQPSPDTPIPELLVRGQFRAAAIASVQALTSSPASATTAAAHPPVDPKDHARIFSLFYTRLACLCLIDAVPLAAQEAKALEDLDQAFYFDPTTGTHLMPWELRVIAIRLQTLGFGDPRRAVMSYYALAAEARSLIARAEKSHDHSAMELWKRQLAELGVKVAGALIEMDDLGGAADHLISLNGQGQDGTLAMSKALLWLHLGDVDAARHCVQDGKAGDIGEKVVSALADMADGKYEPALDKWRGLKSEIDKAGTEDEMVGVNLAVCLLYLGRMEEVGQPKLTALDAGLTINRAGRYWKLSWVPARPHALSCSI